MNFLLSLLYHTAHAQELIPCPDGTMADPSIGCVSVPSSVVNPESSLLDLMLSASSSALSFVAGLTVIFMIYGGVRYATAVGNDEQISKAKRILFWSGFGLVVSLLSLYVVRFVIGVIS